jgi:hypothetical protein
VIKLMPASISNQDKTGEPEACRTPCPNPLCKDGYIVAKDSGHALRVCSSCDGLGFLRSVSENRKRYYALRNLVSELELQSRLGRGLTSRGRTMRDREETGTCIFGDVVENIASLDSERMIPDGSNANACFRIS